MAIGRPKRNSFVRSLLSGIAAQMIFNPRRRGKAKAKRGVARNGEAEDATRMYLEFHGKKEKEVLRIQQQFLKAGHYTALGDDPEFWLEPIHFENKSDGSVKVTPKASLSYPPERGVKLATDSEGTDLFIVGDAEIPKEVLGKEGFDTDKRFIVMGTCYGICYDTEKVFDNFVTRPYVHEFGEETGQRPQLVYDQQTKTPLLIGGAYWIAPFDRKIGASPGIRN